MPILIISNQNEGNKMTNLERAKLLTSTNSMSILSCFKKELINYNQALELVANSDYHINLKLKIKNQLINAYSKKII
tara:strand:- start:90 stop:320 length:231 start_codon:yes stop_codon:yes gene_type:complete